MNHACLSVGTRWESNETICVVMKLHESTCHDPKPDIRLKLIPVHSEKSSVEISALELIKFTWKPWQDAIIFLLTAGFPSIKTPFFTYYLHWGNDYKTGWKALCCGMYYILGGLLDGIGSACMSCCREFEGYRSVAWFGKKAGEIKRNDVAHLLHLYSISSPQTAGPGCRDERLSGGQERRSWVRRKMASCLSNAWKRNPPPPPPPGSGIWTYLWKPCHFG